ncbi:hypothetical protein BEH94_00205 [Candidatus Altiarchaeales archaeon WOR_SM1_SCG]|nr:hypothetical protein BEH94_00205 [Candidatus Altiarchaeales archaeon WOR_SM1_SCG]
MADFKNNFSWSKSRDETFKSCKRKYYYHYYGSWGGWEFNAERKIRQLYILKNLQSRYMWLGSIVHEFIEAILTKELHEHETNLYKLFGRMRQAMRQDFENSEKGLYTKYPKIHGRTYGLLEHEYNIFVANDEWKEISDNAEKCVANFYNSDTFNYIKSVERKNWLPIESMRTFDFEGCNVYVVIDFAMRGGKNKNKNSKDKSQNLLSDYFTSEYDSYSDENLIIFDWKTGKIRFEEMDVQLACYSLYSKEKWNVSPENIICKKYNVMIDKVDDYEINDDVIEKVKEHIRGSITEMKELLYDKEENTAREDDFELTEDENECRMCNFKKVCPKWG